MRANGKITKPTDLESSNMPMATCLRANGSTIRPTD